MKKEVANFQLIYFFKKAVTQLILFQIKNHKLQKIVKNLLFMLQEHFINHLLEMFKKWAARKKMLDELFLIIQALKKINKNKNYRKWETLIYKIVIITQNNK